jgi:hypothetical protein
MAFPEWFVGPPVLGGANKYQVAEAANQAEATKLQGEGYKGPYATLAAAQSAANAATSTATSTEFNPSLPNPLSGVNAIGAFFNKLGEANTWIRVGKVVIGGLLLVVGLVHITGAAGAVADAARKVPVPI